MLRLPCLVLHGSSPYFIHGFTPYFMQYSRHTLVSMHVVFQSLPLTDRTMYYVYAYITQIVHLSPEISMEMTFGNDQGPKMSSVTSAESAVVSVPPSQLLSGQGYLLGRLTHDASWPVLIRSLTYLLESKHSKQWYVY